MGTQRDGARKGRGATSNRSARYESLQRTVLDDGWGSMEAELARPPTTVTEDHSRRIISYNQSPDIRFDRSINPYRGCEHGCIYCYARPSHAWLGLSPGLDFETKLTFKPDAAKLLRRELAQPNYRCAPIALGANTDPYQPVERTHRITRQVLEVLWEHRHPVVIVTKSALVERDMDILTAMSKRGLCNVAVSVTTLDPELARRMEPRATAPRRRVAAVEALSRAGIPVAVLVAPVIPFLNDHELEDILTQVRGAGAGSANYSLIRLPLEISELFQEWLEAHFPLKAEHIFNRIRDTRDGKDYVSEFGTRMRGTGVFANLLATRFRLASSRLAFPGLPKLDCTQFRAPGAKQLSMF